MKKIISILTLVPFLAWGAPPNQGTVDCRPISKKVAKEIKADKSEVLKIVATNAEEEQNCACEIVKTAILNTKAGNKLVGQIVESAINAAPEQAETIVQCAAAVAPRAYLEINAGAEAAGSDATVGAPGGDNPLDFPGDPDSGGVDGSDINSGAGTGDGSGQGGAGQPNDNNGPVTDPDPNQNNP